jgi:hypothetical protein
MTKLEPPGSEAAEVLCQSFGISNQVKHGAPDIQTLLIAVVTSITA